MEKNPETESLDDLFKFGFKAIRELEDMNPTDAKYNQLVAEAIRRLEECTTFVCNDSTRTIDSLCGSR